MIERRVFCTFTSTDNRSRSHERERRGRSTSLSVWVALLALLAACFDVQRLEGQVLYGSIIGTVTDQAGTSVPNAKVRITSRGTTQSRETETDAAGTYAFPSLPGDAYEVVITKPGFQTVTIRGTNVAPDNTVPVDAVLTLAPPHHPFQVSSQPLPL